MTVVDESDRDDDEEHRDDGFGRGEPCGDGELPSSAPAGGEANETRQSKAQDKGKKKKGGAQKKKGGVGPAQLKRGLRWDEDEHHRFVEVSSAQHWRREMKRVQRHGSGHRGRGVGQKAWNVADVCI